MGGGSIGTKNLPPFLPTTGRFLVICQATFSCSSLVCKIPHPLFSLLNACWRIHTVGTLKSRSLPILAILWKNISKYSCWCHFEFLMKCFILAVIFVLVNILKYFDHVHKPLKNKIVNIKRALDLYILILLQSTPNINWQKNYRICL